MNEVVKYSNDLHTVALAKLKPVEARVFFALLYKLKEQKTKEVTFTWQELAKQAHVNRSKDSTKFSKRLDGITNGIVGLPIKRITDTGWSKFVPFHTFRVDTINETLTAAIHPEFEYLLNNLKSNFVRWELPQFLHLKGRYAQALYRHLRQFRSSGIWTVDIETFRNLLDVPKSYRIPDVTKSVLDPAIKELVPYFKGLRWHYVKQTGPGGRGRGGKVARINFTFQSQLELDQDWSDPYAVIGDIHESNDVLEVVDIECT